MSVLRVSAAGDEVMSLLPRSDGARRVIGVTGPPGAGKSCFATFLLGLLGPRGALVPMDGFHLADVTLARRNLLDRKGAPETFDMLGYAAVLARVKHRPRDIIFAPGFDRGIEQPLAGAIEVPPSADVVVTEGNYLLLDRPGWRDVRAAVDEVWHLRMNHEIRKGRLVARHVRYGKSADEAAAWVARVDEPNARLVEAASSRADLVLDLTHWQPPMRCM